MRDQPPQDDPAIQPSPSEPVAQAGALDGTVDAEATVDPRVLEMLVCPMTRGSLSYVRAAQVLVSRRPKVAYTIVNGVPILVAEEARELDDNDPLLKR